MDKSTPRSRHPDAIRQAFLWALLPTLVLFLIAPSVGDAQVTVTTSITSTPGAGNLGTTVTKVGNLYNITDGTRPGSGPNLFHSFGDFGVGAGDIANFLNNTGLQTTNILGRVTGGNISNIYGTIQTNGTGGFGNANLFLVNPSGFVFGPNGSLNVGGSVSFTTAQYLRLFDEVTGNSANFYANPANDGLANSVLAVAPLVEFGFLSPAAYGFLTAPDPNATITVQGSELSVPPGLPDSPGHSISLVGGDVIIQGGARLSAPNGNILLASAATPGEFDVATLEALPNLDGASFTSFGSVSLALGSSIDVRGVSTVFIKGGQIVLSVNDATLSTSENPALADTISLSPGSSIVTSNFGTDPGADVQLIASNVQMDGASMLSTTTGNGPGGNISVTNAQTVNLTNGAAISVATSGSGRGGDVVIAAGNVHLDTSTITTGTSGPGRGGDVRITADSLTLENASVITTKTEFGDGVGGDLFLNVGTLNLLAGPSGGSEIRSTNFNFGTDLDGDGVADVTGVGGNVTVQGLLGVGSVADSVVLSGGSRVTSDTILNGDGGRISIAAKSLDLSGHDTNGVASTINSSTFGTGLGGNVLLAVQQLRLTGGTTVTSHTDSASSTDSAGGTLTVQGLEGTGSKADSIILTGSNSGIISETFGIARLGDIVVQAKTVSLTKGAVIKAGTPIDTGTAGNVTIDADLVGISGGSFISSQASEADAGQVKITANELTLDNGSIVTNTSSLTGGRGGDVLLDVGTVSLSNGATINSSTFATGRAGDITMNVGTLSLANGSSISSASSGTDPVTNFVDGTTVPPGTAGNVTITATGSFTSDASTVATSSEANHGGDISITAQSVGLSNGTLITANSKAPLEVTKLVLDQDGLLVSQVVGDGNAGNITIHSGSTFVMNNSSMTTEATQASGGQIEITAPEMVRLIDSRVSTTVAGSATDTAGGDITIDPQFVVLQNSQIIAQAFAGAGGAINITAGVFLVDPASIVDASSTLGISGTVNIQSPVQNIGGRLTPLSQKFSSAAALLAQRCAARAADGKFSTFVVAGREGLPAEPGGFLASPSLTAELLGSSLSGRDPHTQFPAVTGLFQEYDARPIQLAMFGNACR